MPVPVGDSVTAEHESNNGSARRRTQNIGSEPAGQVVVSGHRDGGSADSGEQGEQGTEAGQGGTELADGHESPDAGVLGRDLDRGGGDAARPPVSRCPAVSRPMMVTVRQASTALTRTRARRSWRR